MPGNFWEQDEQVQPANGGGPKPIISVPDYQSIDDVRADRGQANSDVTTGISVRGENRAIGNDAFAHTQTLRGAYDANPEVKNYRVVAPQLIDALNTPDDASGDNALLYAYSKIMDPGSVVRESETASAAGGASVFDQTVANLKKQFGIEGGGQLSPNIREGLKRQAIARSQQLGKIYRAQRQRYTEDAQAYGIDPVRVIGRDDFEPYLDQFNAYQSKQDQGAAGAGGARGNGTVDPAMRGGLPIGTDIEFGMDAKEGPFDRERYIQENMGINSDQEARYLAYFNQNSGNPNLSVDNAKQWFAASGINAPSDADLAKLVEDVRKGGQIGPIDTSGAEQAYIERLRGDNAQRGFDPSGVGGYAARAAQGASFGLTDEIYGAVGGLDALLDNRGVADGYRLARDQTRQAFDDMGEQQGALGTAAELAGGLAGGIGGASRGAMTAGRAAREGAAMGALSGYGYGEGLQDSAVGAAGGAAVGAGAGYAIGRGAEALAARRAARAAAPLTPGGEVITAADDLNAQFGTNIAPIPADAGGVTTRRVTGATAQLPLAAGSIVRGGQKVSNEAKAARDAIASLTGTAATDEAAGEAALTGAQKYIKSSKTKVDALYAKARRLGGNEPVDLANARATLDANIAELSNTPGGAPGLSRLQALRDTLDTPYPVEGVKRMRTTLRDEFLQDGLRGSDLERRVKQVVDAADDDIADSLVAAGKGSASQAYRKASASHKERIDIIDDVLEPFIGKTGDKSVEDVMKAIDTATKTKGARLGKFLSALPVDDAGTVRATIISKLGKASNGTQDAAGEAFSLPQFLTHWNQMSGKAKSELFGGEVRSALDNLAKVAEGTKEAQRFANFSNTGSVVGGLATGANAAGFLSAPISSTAALAAQYGAGKLLASPSFARWLAKMPSGPGLIEKHVSSLSRIAANDNAIAQDIIGLQASLREALAGAPQRAAAAPVPSSATPGNTETGAPR